MKAPDPKLHLQISLAKSILRIIAGVTLITGSLTATGILIILAEALGIGEELV